MMNRRHYGRPARVRCPQAEVHGRGRRGGRVWREPRGQGGPWSEVHEMGGEEGESGENDEVGVKSAG